MEWRNKKESDIQDTSAGLLKCSYSTFSTYSCFLVTIPQLRSFMVHPAMQRILYVTVLCGQTLLFFNKSDHPGLQSCNWPQCSPGPTSVSMVTLVHLLSPPEGVQRADEFGCCAQCEDQPTPISVHPTITTAACTYTASPPRISNFKTIVCFLPLCIQTRAAVQWTRLIYLLTIF